MNHKDSLISLRDAVKAGPYETMGHTRRCQKAFPAPKPSEQMTREDYANSIAQMVILAWRNHSLDAALKFKDAVLPDWTAAIVQNMHHKHWNANLSFVLADGSGLHRDSGACDNPATALILACLEVLIAQTADNGEVV